MENVSGLLNVPLIITEKMDGGNVCLERDNCFARSHGQPPTHRSYDAFKGLHARVKYKIPADIQLFGEWLYAKHSIHYDNLPNYLMLFGVRNKKTGQWSNWDEVVSTAKLIETCTVPVLDKLFARNEAHLQSATSRLANTASVYGEKEGVVVRHRDGFADEDFTKCLGKWVRANHVTDKGFAWKFKQIEKNGLLGK
jgi:hypothetical protein